ncbi:MAG: hypothetical protein H6618_03710 [Deltaproteobacteria bacterium]|nr:hypothetical protein [Deltaproteobacteria bacterium]
MLEISQDTRDVIRKVQIQAEDPTETLRQHEGKAQHVGANTFTGIILRRAAIGAFAHTSNTALLFRDHENGALETLYTESLLDAGMTFSLAQDFGKYFSAGLTSKILKRNRAYFRANATEGSELQALNSADQISMTGTGAGADLGFMFNMQGKINLSFGLVVHDLGDTRFIPDKETSLSKEERPLKNIPQTISAGVSIEPGTKYSKFKLLADFRDLSNAYDISPYKRLHLGAELTLRDVVGFTTGLNQGYPSFGAYVDIRVLRVDVGVYGEEVGKYAGSRPDTRFFLRIAAGI